eukprot:Blabericola_migrator_1__1180@NODE_12_length_24658_cov_176_683258_g9_i0_p8_GENE_NODE_12_length_24658_cov_176_683258_g9_i0NODE_12_length_24658_cov_176_683258_g9_i0_p8_ORF_typecomplete_len391_score59_04Fbox/PF00646_33/0_21_NODE_12_length_24658_cov_176_683258_g9_i035984770
MSTDPTLWIFIFPFLEYKHLIKLQQLSSRFYSWLQSPQVQERFMVECMQRTGWLYLPQPHGLRTWLEVNASLEKEQSLWVDPLPSRVLLHGYTPLMKLNCPALDKLLWKLRYLNRTWSEPPGQSPSLFSCAVYDTVCDDLCPDGRRVRDDTSGDSQCDAHDMHSTGLDQIFPWNTEVCEVGGLMSLATRIVMGNSAYRCRMALSLTEARRITAAATFGALYGPLEDDGISTPSVTDDTLPPQRWNVSRLVACIDERATTGAVEGVPGYVQSRLPYWSEYARVSTGVFWESEWDDTPSTPHTHPMPNDHLVLAACWFEEQRAKLLKEVDKVIWKLLGTVNVKRRRATLSECRCIVLEASSKCALIQCAPRDGPDLKPETVWEEIDAWVESD